MKKLFTLILILFSSKLIFAQTTIFDSINFYGSFRAHVAVFDSVVQVENNGSRVGMYLNRRIVDGVSGFAKLELGTNLVRNNTTFNPDAATNTDESFTAPATDPVTTRLGFIGVQTKFGSLSIGKQWGVYYDVSEWTDNFWVFGGKASGTYNTGNDGGSEGTGRAENTLQYRYSGKIFAIGLQSQLNGLDVNYGASALLKFGNFSVGAAFNSYSPTDQIRAIVGGEKEHAYSYVGGIKYKSEKLYAALVYDYNESEVQYPGDTVVAFPANGAELLVNFLVLPKLRLEAGANYLKPSSTPEVIDPDFDVIQIIVGGAYYFLPDFLTYLEVNIDQGTNTAGNTPPTVFTLGLRYNFSFGASHVKL